MRPRLSTSGLKTLALPRLVEERRPRRRRSAGELAAREAAERWTRDGWQMRAARPPLGYGDFNDLLQDTTGSRGSDDPAPTLPDPFQDALDNAETVLDPAAIDRLKPRLLVEEAAPDRTVSALRPTLEVREPLRSRSPRQARLRPDAGHPGRQVLIVNLVFFPQHGAACPTARGSAPDVLVLVAHTACRPYALREKKGEIVEIDVRLPPVRHHVP